VWDIRGLRGKLLKAVAFMDDCGSRGYGDSAAAWLASI